MRPALLILPAQQVGTYLGAAVESAWLQILRSPYSVGAASVAVLRHMWRRPTREAYATAQANLETVGRASLWQLQRLSRKRGTSNRSLGLRLVLGTSIASSEARHGG